MSKFIWKDVVGHLQISLKKHSPEILTGIGVGGMITTVVLAVRATPEALRRIENKKRVEKRKDLTVKETVQAAGYTLSDSVLLKKGAEGYPAGFFEKVYSQATDTVQIIVYDECVFAVFKEDLKAKGESVYVNYRSSCISDLYSEQASREIEEYIASLQVEEKSGRIDRIIKRLK